MHVRRPSTALLASVSILRQVTALNLAILLVSTLPVIVGTMLTDAIYRLVDPRVKSGT